MVQQFAGEQPFQYLAGTEGIPLPQCFPSTVIDVGRVEQERRQLKCGEQEGHAPNDGHAPDAESARHFGVGNRGQETHRNGAHVAVDQVGQEGEPEEDAGEDEVTSAADGAKREAEREQQEMGSDGLRKQSAARPRVTAVLDSVEEVSGDKRREQGGRRRSKWAKSHEARGREKTQRQEDYGEKASPHEEGHQRDGFAESKVCQRHQRVSQGLVGAEHGIAQRPLGRPAIERVFAALHGLHDSFRQGEMENVVIQIHAADGEFRPEGGGVQNQDCE